MLEIRLLGQFDLRRNGETLGLPSRAAQSLLAYLVLNPGVSYRREHLAGLLAPDVGEDAARAAVRHALWRIRKTLGPDPATGRDYLVTDDLAVAFDARSRYWLDAAEVCAHLPADSSSHTRRTVLALYAGDLLPGFYDEWVVLERERIEAAFESKMRLYLEQQVGAGRWDDVVEWAERWIGLGHSPESAYCALMLAHAAWGDASRVKALYQRCVDDLWNGLGVEPSESTRRLYERLAHESVPPFAHVRLLAQSAGGAEAPVEISCPAAPGPAPFKGLEPFDVEDASLFFGREALTVRLVEHLQGNDLLIVVGASGCGKSSLVRAGLVPALLASEERRRNGAGQTSSALPYQILTPTGHPLHALALAVTSSDSVLPAATLSDDMAADPRSLELFLTRQASSGNGRVPRTVLVVDQFEEVFALCTREEERAAFIANLMHATSGGERPDGLLRLVIALRADFYGHCAAYPELRRGLETSQQYIGGMDAAELRRCIKGPLAVGGWEVEPGLVDLLVRDTGSEPGALPLLSHALLETWRARSGRLLTLEGYASTGGVHGAIAHTADTIYSQFDAEEQAVARRIFLRLTALGDGMQETRRRASQDELLQDPESVTLVESVLQDLAAARLITLGNGQVEVAHEALIRQWPVLRQWLAEDREGLRLHRRLSEAAEAWEASERETADLYRGVRLAQAADWAGRHAAELNPTERAFLAASQAEADRLAAESEAQQHRELEAARHLATAERDRAEEQRKSNRELRRRAMLLAATLVFLFAATILSLLMWRQARRGTDAARAGGALAFSRELAASADASITVDHQRAILLALESAAAARAAGVAVPAEAEAALHHTVQSSPLDTSTALAGTTVWNAGGQLVVSREAGGPLRVWDLPELSRVGPVVAKPRYTLQAGAGIFELSPDDRLLAVGDVAGQIELYDAATGTRQGTLRGHTARVTALRFSRDGSRLVSAADDGSVRTWDTTTGAQLVPLVRPAASPRHIDISPDGTRIVADLFDGGVYLWDPVAGQRVLYVIGHQGEPWTVAFCGRSDRFVVGSGVVVRLWDATSGMPLFNASITDSPPSSVACSPDGLRLATAAGPAIRIWDMETGEQQWVMRVGPTVRRLAFSADGVRLLSQHSDGTVKLWDLKGSRELVTLGSGRGSSDVAFSPDASMLAAAGGEAGAFYAWQVPPGDRALTGREAGAWARLYEAGGQASMVRRLAFDPNGGRLATGKLDGGVQLWTLSPDRAPAEVGPALEPPVSPRAADAVADLGFDWAGTRLAVASDAGLRIWDVLPSATIGASATYRLRVFRVGVAPLAVAWSADGSRLAVGLSDDNARIIDPGSDAAFAVLLGHTGAIRDIAYSPDGTQVATASADETACIWDVTAAGPEGATARLSPRFTLHGHASGVNTVAFSPDGASLATGGEDGSVKLWDVRTGRARFTLATLPAPVTGLAFSADGRFLATSGDAVRVFLLRLDDLETLAKQRVSRSLTYDECREYLHSENGVCVP